MTEMIRTNPPLPRTTSASEPLPFVAPPPPHRPSFSRRLQSSSYLFPKTLSSPRMMFDDSGDDGNRCGDGSKNINSSNDDLEDGRGGTIEKENIRGGNRGHRPSARKGARGKTIGGDGVIASSNFTLDDNVPAEKSVRFRFQDKSSIVLHLLHDVPVASQMTPREKSRIWYTPSEHDRFKYDAAKCAGVKIVRYDSEKAGHHFVMMGDFDNGAGAAAASDKQPSGNKRYYNENEYNDRLDSSEIICKRGLGYHFSRCRKHSRIVTRSAVVAWQKTLKTATSGSGGRGNSSDDGKGDNLEKEDKDRMMLALVSAKCSRVAREEARWRGDVDYRVSYPERHIATKSRSVASKTKKRATAGTGLRAPPSPTLSSHQPLAGDPPPNKRQRQNALASRSGSCGDVKGDNEVLSSLRAKAY